MKRFLGGLGKFLGYWIMWLGLAALLCPFLFPFPMWPELKGIFDIIAFVFPIGFVIRFFGMYDKELFDRMLYLIKDIFGILVLSTLPCIAVPIPYVIHHKDGYMAIVKGLLLIAIGLVGVILADKYIKDYNKKKKLKEEEIQNRIEED